MDKQRIEISGRLVAKPEVLTSKDKKSYAKIRVATNKKRKDKNGKEVEKVSYYDALVFGKRAEKSANLDKGAPVRITGDLEVTPYVTKDKNPKAELLIFVREFQVFDLNAFKS